MYPVYITSSPLCLSGSPGMRTHDGTMAAAAMEWPDFIEYYAHYFDEYAYIRAYTGSKYLS